MATFQKRGSTWRAIVRKLGVSTSETFPTKTAAQVWATKTEADIIAGKNGSTPDKTFGDLLEKYAKEVSPTKKGERWEKTRINLFLRDPIAGVKLSELNQAHFGEWRDRRATRVQAASILREWNTLSNACKRAVNEWKWLPSHPMKGVEKPKKSAPRDRLISQEEIDRIMTVAGAGCSVSARVGQAFLFAIETAMRAGEICALRPQDVNLETRVAKVLDGKTHAATREVPLSKAAVEIVKLMQENCKADTVFNLNPPQLDAMFRKIKAQAMVTDLHFHDTRHEAITRLAKKFSVLALARAVGHRDLRMLQVYYNESAEDLAKLL